MKSTKGNYMYDKYSHKKTTPGPDLKPQKKQTKINGFFNSASTELPYDKPAATVAAIVASKEDMYVPPVNNAPWSNRGYSESKDDNMSSLSPYALLRTAQQCYAQFRTSITSNRFRLKPRKKDR